jgi:3-phenylpropionate/trans-cinnamate dioxygenase ferredoxin reductase subunit
VLATGAAPRRLDVPGAGLDGVHHLRSVADALRLADAIRGARRVAVVGAGWIGSEVAASARQMGAEVVLIDPGPVPLRRVVGDEVGGVFRRLHADHGVELRLPGGVAELRGSGRSPHRGAVEQVVLRDGTVEDADVVVVGIGVTPRLDLAMAAGLPVDGGVLVDPHLESGAAGVYVAGDVAAAWNARYDRYLRVEHWSNALHQGLVAGTNAGGGHETHTRLPYFFSDQYDLGLEYVGQADPGDTVVVRGSLADRAFVAFWQHDGVVTAAMHVNVWDAIGDLRAVVTAGRPLDPARLADPGVPLAELV